MFRKHWLPLLAIIGIVSKAISDIVDLKKMAQSISVLDLISYLIYSIPLILVIVLWYKYQKLYFDNKRVEIHSRIDAWLNVMRIRKLQNNEPVMPRDEEKKYINSKLRDTYSSMSEERRNHILECFYEQKNFWHKWPD